MYGRLSLLLHRLASLIQLFILRSFLSRFIVAQMANTSLNASCTRTILDRNQLVKSTELRLKRASKGSIKTMLTRSHVICCSFHSVPKLASKLGKQNKPLAVRNSAKVVGK